MKTVLKILICTAIVLPFAYGIGIAGKSSPKATASKAAKSEEIKERKTVVVGAAKVEKTEQISEQKTQSKKSGDAVELRKADDAERRDILRVGDADQVFDQQSSRTGEQINWQVLSAGGGFGSSTNFGVFSVIGQTATGTGSSTNFTIQHGFVQNFGPGGCCVGTTGNVDNDPLDIVDIGDLTFLIDHLFITFPILACHEEGNVDGDPTGVVDIGDLTFLIDHLFITFPPTSACM